MSYLSRYRAMGNEDFKGRVFIAEIEVAHAVLAEDPDTPNHEARVREARGLLTNSVDTYNYLLAAASNPTIAAKFAESGDASAVPDSDILYAVTLRFNENVAT